MGSSTRMGSEVVTGLVAASMRNLEIFVACWPAVAQNDVRITPRVLGGGNDYLCGTAGSC